MFENTIHKNHATFSSVCMACEKSAPVDARLSACSRCHIATYCSQSCQKKHWPSHKRVCETRKDRVIQQRFQKLPDLILQNLSSESLAKVFSTENPLFLLVDEKNEKTSVELKDFESEKEQLRSLLPENQFTFLEKEINKHQKSNKACVVLSSFQENEKVTYFVSVLGMKNEAQEDMPKALTEEESIEGLFSELSQAITPSTNKALDLFARIAAMDDNTFRTQEQNLVREHEKIRTERFKAAQESTKRFMMETKIEGQEPLSQTIAEQLQTVQNYLLTGENPEAVRRFEQEYLGGQNIMEAAIQGLSKGS